MKKRVYGVTIASDVSQLLWPLHRSASAMSRLVSVDEQVSLLQQTIAVTDALIPVDQRVVVLTHDQANSEKASLSSLAKRVIIHPHEKGSAAALLHACLLIQVEAPEAVVVALPTDVYMPDPKRVLSFISHALDYTDLHNKLVLLGVKALYGSGQHGYISFYKTEQTPYPVTFFHEEPGDQLGVWYEQEGALWNSRIVVTRAAFFTELCKEHVPTLYEALSEYLFEQGSFELIPETSLEKDLLEKISDSVVLPADFAWCSLRSLESFLSAKKQGARQQHIITIDASNNLVEARDSLVALVGVDNICIVQSDDILLVVSRDQLDKVKLVLEMLKEHQKEEYL